MVKEIKVKRDWNKFEKCCDCGEAIEVKYNRGKKTHSQKNSIEFWTKQIRDKDKYKCDNCWLSIYYKQPQEFVGLVPNPEIRNMFSNYVNNGWFGGWEKTENIKQKAKSKLKSNRIK